MYHYEISPKTLTLGVQSEDQCLRPGRRLLCDLLTCNVFFLIEIAYVLKRKERVQKCWAKKDKSVDISDMLYIPHSFLYHHRQHLRSLVFQESRERNLARSRDVHFSDLRRFEGRTILRV